MGELRDHFSEAAETTRGEDSGGIRRAAADAHGPASSLMHGQRHADEDSSRADEAVRGAQEEMARLLPPSIGESSSAPLSNTTSAVLRDGWSKLESRERRFLKRPAIAGLRAKLRRLCLRHRQDLLEPPLRHHEQGGIGRRRVWPWPLKSKSPANQAGAASALHVCGLQSSLAPCAWTGHIPRRSRQQSR